MGRQQYFIYKAVPCQCGFLTVNQTDTLMIIINKYYFKPTLTSTLRKSALYSFCYTTASYTFPAIFEIIFSYIYLNRVFWSPGMILVRKGKRASMVRGRGSSPAVRASCVITPAAALPHPPGCVLAPDQSIKGASPGKDHILAEGPPVVARAQAPST